MNFSAFLMTNFCIFTCKFESFFKQVLTWMMKETLGGNSESLMLCCISACEKTVQETVNCLKYGSMVRNIINKPVINEVSKISLCFCMTWLVVYDQQCLGVISLILYWPVAKCLGHCT